MDLLTANDRPGRHAPSWYAATATPPGPYAPLEGTVRADLCVVGGGFTGLSTAWHAARAGLSVVLVEAQRMGFGASGRNGGQVGTGQRQGQDWLEARAGRDAARALWDIAVEAVDMVRELSDRPEVGAGFRPGIVHACRSAAETAHEAASVERLRRDYGHHAIEALDRDAIRAIVGSDAYVGGSLDMGAGHLHPLRLAFGLARLAEGAGAALHEGSRVTRVTDDGPRAVVETDGGRVEADHVVLACNGYLGGLSPRVAARVMPINNFVAATEPLGDRADAVLSRDVAVADDRFVVNYWRLTEDRRLLFGGGESYGYSFPADLDRKVRRPMEQVYPQLRGIAIDHVWGGTLAITMTRMPLFARPSARVLSASGYSGHGVAMACMAGRVLAEAVTGRAGRFDTFAALAPPPFPGGPALRAPLLALAMGWYGLRDRLGV